ncbi:SafA/ExsA family spore coat assembly protein [Bacillus xiapuensis]|uniref:SafA/ExsA family spore coat assembly protein n=1 Tax=Bacillus xiapuensis TaxID=2014075 RepID=A0ABU6NA67_9BACI|nr:SafA/ExsA family spore coat assembly protein [Bacillus xiapuensis]
MKIHIVQKGDTLWKIAKKYGVNFEELKKMNSQLSNPDMIMPGMKVKVPTTGGMVKKEAPVGKPEAAINLGAKKEMPIVEHPFAKEKPIVKEMPIKEAPIKEMPIKEAPIKEVPIKEAPIKEVPIKEQPILKEAPKTPYTPKMPLPVVPEIDINNYYMSNMTNMTVKPELPPKPANILPEVKEVPKKEVPIPPPPVEAPIQQPCVPITPVMPGPGFCPPLEFYPQPCMPYAQGGGYPGEIVGYPGYPGVPGGYPGEIAGYPGAMPGGYPGEIAGYPGNPGAPVGGAYPGTYPGAYPVPGVAPTVAGAPFVPHFDDESSSFMPQMPVMNPGYNPGAVMGVQNPAQYPAGGYPQMLAGPAAPTGYPEFNPGAAPAGYPSAPAGYPGAVPVGYPERYPEGMPEGYPQAGYSQAGYSQAGYPQAGYSQAGYPQAGYPAGQQLGYPGEYPVAPGGGNPASGGVPYGAGVSYGQTPYGYPPMGGSFEGTEMTGTVGGPAQGLPVGTGAMGDCGCGGPAKGAATNFVPTTPPIYSPPYTGPVNVAQPPYMNPYGIGLEGAYGMPRFVDESNDEN